MVRWWGEFLRLQERYAQRYEVSGREARDAAGRLRWSGERLVGEWAPPVPGSGC